MLHILALLILFQSYIFADQSQLDRIHFDVINSTQTYAKEHAGEILTTPGKWAVVTANRQTDGRGFQDRKWESASRGNIYATFVTLYPKDKSNELFHIIQISGLSVAHTLTDFGLSPEIKWVNDVFLQGKKVSGSLCEIFPSQLNDYYYLLIGIGINVNMTQDEVASIGNPATSMSLAGSTEYDKEVVLAHLFDHLSLSVDQLLQNGFSPFFATINKLLAFKGKRIDVELKSKEILSGRLVGIDRDGALLLSPKQGTLVSIQNGRIVQVHGA